MPGITFISNRVGGTNAALISYPRPLRGHTRRGSYRFWPLTTRFVQCIRPKFPAHATWAGGAQARAAVLVAESGRKATRSLTQNGPAPRIGGRDGLDRRGAPGRRPTGAAAAHHGPHRVAGRPRRRRPPGAPRR